MAETTHFWAALTVLHNYGHICHRPAVRLYPSPQSAHLLHFLVYFCRAWEATWARAHHPWETSRRESLGTCAANSIDTIKLLTLPASGRLLENSRVKEVAEKAKSEILQNGILLSPTFSHLPCEYLMQEPYPNEMLTPKLILYTVIGNSIKS